jgi:putative flippase GtrA
MTASSSVDADLRPVLAARSKASEFARYFGCSAAALAADFGLFTLGLRLGWGYPVAALLGFTAGLWIAYSLSVRLVFRARAVADARLEFMLFALIGILGLLLTEALLWLFISRLGVPPLLAKLCTAGAVFITNFALRKGILFTERRERPAP